MAERRITPRNTLLTTACLLGSVSCGTAYLLREDSDRSNMRALEHQIDQIDSGRIALKKILSAELVDDMAEVRSLTPQQVAGMPRNRLVEAAGSVQDVSVELADATGVSAEQVNDLLVTPATENAFAHRGINFKPTTDPCLNATIMYTRNGVQANFPLSSQ